MIYRKQNREAMASYMNEIGRIPLVSVEEERVLAAGIKAGNEYARAKLIQSNLRLVVKIAHDFKGFGLPLLDLISEGNIGLMRAVEKFDPNKGAKFSSYGAWWIKQSMRRALSDKGKTIRVPTTQSYNVHKFRKASAELESRLGYKPTEEEIAEFLSITRTKMRTIQRAEEAFKTISLHDPIREGEEDTRMDLIPDENAKTPYELASSRDSTSRIDDVMRVCLDKREYNIIVSRFGLDGSRPQTLEELSEKYGRTRERVRQIQKDALKKLRIAMEEVKQKASQKSRKERSTLPQARILYGLENNIIPDDSQGNIYVVDMSKLPAHERLALENYENCNGQMTRLTQMVQSRLPKGYGISGTSLYIALCKITDRYHLPRTHRRTNERALQPA